MNKDKFLCPECGGYLTLQRTIEKIEEYSIHEETGELMEIEYEMENSGSYNQLVFCNTCNKSIKNLIFDDKTGIIIEKGI